MLTEFEQIECRKPGCGYAGAGDVVSRHLDGKAVLRCPKCNSKNVKVVGINAPKGRFFPRIVLVMRRR